MRSDALLSRAVRDNPRLRIRSRSAWPMRLVDPILRLLGRPRPWVTVIGSTIYMTGWDYMSEDQRYLLLAQALIDVAWYRKWPLGTWAWPLNHVLFPLAYCFLLPLFWTVRARVEREVYTQCFLALHEMYGTFSDAQMEDEAERLVRVFSGPSYFWMGGGTETYEWAMETMRRINEGRIS